MEGPYQGRQETFSYKDFDGNAHAEAAQLLITSLRVPGTVREIEFLDTGSVYVIDNGEASGTGLEGAETD